MSEGDEIASSPLYKHNKEWSDVTPIYPTPEENGAVKIAVSEDFTDAFAYFRAILIKQEKSERVVKLLEDCIRLNPANYTVWQYRREVLEELSTNGVKNREELLKHEMNYLDQIIEETPKNYQVWHHRRIIVEWIGESAAHHELSFTGDIIQDENKNYHAWQHRQWVVRVFKTPMQPEMDFSLTLLLEDPRNNSAYNYRYFLLTLFDKIEDTETIDIEINLAKRFIEMMPNNESVWNYLTGLLLVNGITSNTGVVHFVDDLFERTEKEKRSPFLLSFLADIMLENIEKQKNEKESGERAKQLYNELIDLDPVRINYWKHQRTLVDQLLTKNSFKIAAK